MKKVRPIIICLFCLGVFITALMIVRQPGKVISIAIVDFRSQKAFDEMGKSIPMQPDWARVREFTPTAKRRVYFSVVRPPIGECSYRIRFSNSSSHSTGTSPGRVAEVSSDFPITDNQDSVKVSVDSAGTSWETIYDGKVGESTSDAKWNLQEINGSLLTIRNACPQDQQYEYAYRMTLNPPLKEYEFNSPIPDASGHFYLFSREQASRLGRVRIERSKYVSIYSGWIAYGARGSESTARKSVTAPVLLGAFSGQLQTRPGSLGKYFTRDSVGWNQSGKRIELDNENDFGPTLAMDERLPGWIVFRIPFYEDGIRYRLMDDQGHNLDAETRIADPKDGEGKLMIRSISSRWLKSKVNLRLQVASGAFVAEQEATRFNPGDYRVKIDRGEFLVYQHRSKSGTLFQTDVMAGFSLDQEKDYRIVPVGSDGVKLTAGAVMRGPSTIGTLLGPGERDAKVVKVILESRPFKTYEFNDVPLMKPKL
jgi:hypothetical protein